MNKTRPQPLRRSLSDEGDTLVVNKQREHHSITNVLNRGLYKEQPLDLIPLGKWGDISLEP